jgi:hypothetical protein
MHRFHRANDSVPVRVGMSLDSDEVSRSAMAKGRRVVELRKDKINAIQERVWRRERGCVWQNLKDGRCVWRSVRGGAGIQRRRQRCL